MGEQLEDATRPSPEDDLSRIRRVGRWWLGRVARRQGEVSRDGGEDLTYSPGEPAKEVSQEEADPALNGNGHSNGNGATGIAAIIAVADLVRDKPFNRPMVQKALERLPPPEEMLAVHRRRNSLVDRRSSYPTPLELGPQMDQDLSVWVDDPRKFLPEDEQPSRLALRSDREYLDGLASMLDYEQDSTQ